MLLSCINIVMLFKRHFDEGELKIIETIKINNERNKSPGLLTALNSWDVSFLDMTFVELNFIQTTLS